MAEEMMNYADQILGEVTSKVKDLEEKQKITKDRLLLIGENFIETKEKQSNQILEIKKDIETLKQDMNRIKLFLETASTEFSKYARKEDLDILRKQAKMFQPLEFVKKTELKQYINAQ